MNKEFEALDKLEECANGMKDLPKSNWSDLAENQAELDLKIMDWVETIKFELFKGNQALAELQTIKEAKPSEAIKYLEEEIKNLETKLKKDIKLRDKLNVVYQHIELENCISRISTYEKKLNQLNAIKQALLKAQEQEKVLNSIIKHLSFEGSGVEVVKDFITGKEETKYIIKVESKDTGATIHIHLDTEEHYTFKDMLKGANNEI